jgi:RNA polymerase sigma factor (sigma-70 family)
MPMQAALSMDSGLKKHEKEPEWVLSNLQSRIEVIAMYGRRADGEFGKREFDAACLGFKQLLRCKRFSPHFVETHGDDLFATATLEYSRKLAEGEEIENPAGWLIACAWRRTKSQLEAEARRPRVVSAEKCEPLVDEDRDGPEDVLLNEDRFRKVREAVNELSVAQRRILWLAYFDEFTVRSAGRYLNWTSSKAQRAHEGAKRRLHDLLGVSSADELAIVGLAAYISVGVEGRTGNLLERAAQRYADLLAPIKQQIAGGGTQLKEHATTAVSSRGGIDPTPLAAARPGTVATVLASCVLTVGGAATYCVQQGVNPVGAASGLIASSGGEEETTPTEAAPPPTPTYTPAEPSPEAEEVSVPAAEPESKSSEKAAEPKPQAAPAPEDSFEPTASASVSGEGESESIETSEAPAPVESAARPAPVAANSPPQFGGP